MAVLAGVAVMAVANASAVEAAVIQATFKGTVAWGIDDIGQFGPAGGVLDGRAFTASYFIDDAIPGITFYNGSESQIVGGETQGLATAPVKATFRVGSKTVDISGGYYDYAFQADLSGGIKNVAYLAGEIDNVSSNYYWTQVSNNIWNYISSICPADFHVPCHYDVKPTDSEQSQYVLLMSTDRIHWDRAVGMGLATTSVTVGPAVDAPAVPEPSTWAMLLLGTGLLGGVVRRRRSGVLQVRRREFPVVARSPTSV
jgi:hypothetical protein